VAEEARRRSTTSWSAITRDAARAGGLIADVLLTLAVAARLVMRIRWQS